MVLVEAAVETVRSALAAQQGGAGRIELCASLNDGGITPSIGLIEAALEDVSIPVFVMIRPRPGGFAYDAVELGIMERDITVARELGVDGLVFGVLDAQQRVDFESMRRLQDAAGEMPVTFHRAIDRTPDIFAALDTLMELGVSRVLSSGGAASALDGADTLTRMVEHAAGRIHIMAGGGVRESNAAEIVRRAGVSELHTRLINGPHWEELDEQRMRALLAAIRP